MKYIIPYLCCAFFSACPVIAGEDRGAVPNFAISTNNEHAEVKSIDQWMQNAKETRAKRVEDAFENSSKAGFRGLLVNHFARLWTGDDLPAVNAELRSILTSDDPETIRLYNLHDKWSLWLAPSLYRIYWNFSSHAEGPRAGRLEPETESIILEWLWKHTQDKNDRAMSEVSSWWLVGSENHDLHAKVTALVTSRIFKEHPEYQNSLYPNKGEGAGHDYWFHASYGNSLDYGPPPQGKFGDATPSKPEENYDAWVTFFKEYIRQRARHGFFLEVGASGYMKFTISYLLDIRDYGGDPELSELAEKFLNVIWADWAVDQLNGHRGGAITRWVDYPNGDSMYEGATFLMGGNNPALARHAWYSLFVSDYELPRAVWALALRREAMGNFVYTSRRPGEEDAGVAWERPAGMERSLLLNPESRLLRYSYVTPEFILGTQMDHPGALHSHLSISNRWQGMLFNATPPTRVYATGMVEKEDKKWVRQRDAYFKSVQHERALVLQRSRSVMNSNPEWFPKSDKSMMETGVWFGHLGADAIEHDGWIFVGSADAWLAVRPLAVGAVRWSPKLNEISPNQSVTDLVSGNTYSPLQQCWKWTDGREAIVLNDKYSPILFLAASKFSYPTIEDFQSYVLRQDLQLRKTVVEGHFNVHWAVESPSMAVIDFPAANDQMPKINGKYIDYAPDKLFQSPYLNSDYGSAIIEINQGDAQMRIDFNEGASAN